MRFTFLGTASAFGYPQPFCTCADCTKARREGGKNLRKRSTALVNDDLLIDLGPDILTASYMHQVSLTNVRYCLQTHPHSDHLDLSHLLSRSLDLNTPTETLHFYASPATLAYADEFFQQNLSPHRLSDPQTAEDLRLVLHPVAPYETFSAGPYQVTALKANHAPNFQALIYAISSNGRAVLYGTDTEALPEETWQALKSLSYAFDLVIFDHTNGSNPPAYGHLNAQLVTEHTQRMRQEGILKEGGETYITHISHGGNPTHEALAEASRPRGYQVAYDGLVLDL